jgi:acetylornithine deacetylase
MNSVSWLDRLIAFPTISRDSNLDLIACVRAHLDWLGARTQVIADDAGRKANLFVTLGPDGDGGVLLSGHTDVVPVDGQAWNSDPFRMTERDGLLFGRGAADMKGFLACTLHAASLAAARRLAAPLHLAFSYDEEIGCVGVRSMLEMLQAGGPRPSLCLVGEPTGMAVATGHKGKLAARATCCGIAGHSALAPRALNAIHLAADFVQCLRARQDVLAASGAQDAAYDVPYSTVHVGRIDGGVALNIVPDRCTLDFEIRNIAGDDAQDVLAGIAGDAAALSTVAQTRFPGTGIRIEVFNAYPGLDMPEDSAAVAMIRALTGSTAPLKVAFGTEGGLYCQRLGLPTLVCGPGHMAQGHVPDEFVSRQQLAQCDAMLAGLVERLAA